MPRNEKKDSKKNKDQLWQRADGVCFWGVFLGHKSWKSPNLRPIQEPSIGNWSYNSDDLWFVYFTNFDGLRW